MPSLVPFSRTVTLGAPATSLTLSSIPQTAQHLMLIVRARSHDQTATGLFCGLRISGDVGPNTYDGNTLRFVSGTAGGQADDGIDLEQVILGDLTPSDVPSAVFGFHFGLIPRYAASEPHVVMAMGFARPDDSVLSDANFATYLAGAQHVPAVLGAVTSLTLVPEAGNLAVGSSITVVGLVEQGDSVNVARSAGAVGAIDFSGDEIKDVTLAAGANVFSATNPRLGRTISLRLSGGNGTTTITLPAGTELLSNTYAPGQVGWLVIRCVDEVGPGYVANLRDVL